MATWRLVGGTWVDVGYTGAALLEGAWTIGAGIAGQTAAITQVTETDQAQPLTAIFATPDAETYIVPAPVKACRVAAGNRSYLVPAPIKTGAIDR